MPGDTAADSDILPRKALENDGSKSDKLASMHKSSSPDYAKAHW